MAIRLEYERNGIEMLWWICNHIRKNKIWNKVILNTVEVVAIENKLCITQIRYFGFLRRVDLWGEWMEWNKYLANEVGEGHEKTWWEALRFNMSYKGLAKIKTEIKINDKLEFK